MRTVRRGLAAITAFVAMITGCGSQSGPVPAASSSPTPDTYGTLACTTLLDGGEHSLLGEAWRVISRRAEWDDADWVAWGEVVVDVLTVTASRATSPKLAEHAQVTLDGLHAGRYGDLITVGDGIAFNPGTLFTRMVELGLWCVGEGLTPLETYTEAITPPRRGCRRAPATAGCATLIVPLVCGPGAHGSEDARRWFARS